VNRQAQANQIAANRADLVAQRLAAGQMLAAPGFPIWPRQPAIAYAPVVQWFPTGTQLSVDPYGGIGFSTSQYLGAGYYGVPFHGANCPCRLCRGRIRFGQPNVTPPPEREIYYDGLRTRVEPWSDGGRRSRP
jgi:hypothetical protein